MASASWSLIASGSPVLKTLSSVLVSSADPWLMNEFQGAVVDLVLIGVVDICVDIVVIEIKFTMW